MDMTPTQFKLLFAAHMLARENRGMVIAAEAYPDAHQLAEQAGSNAGSRAERRNLLVVDAGRRNRARARQPDHATRRREPELDGADARTAATLDAHRVRRPDDHARRRHVQRLADAPRRRWRSRAHPHRSSGSCSTMTSPSASSITTRKKCWR